MKWYLIKYTVDTGWEYYKDTALIKAEDESKAKEYLRKYIGKLGNDYGVGTIFDICEFDGNIFTGKCGAGII